MPVRFSSGVVFEEVELQGVIVHLPTDEVFSINGTGAFILSQLKKSISPTEIVRQMVSEFEVDTATAERDIQDFVSDLISRGILESVP